MGATFSQTGIVLKKTKLGETDVILTILSDDGGLVQGVLKGARNPKSKTVGKAELFSEQKILFAQGKSLNIITESTIEKARKKLTTSYDSLLAASVVAELALKTSAPENPHERFFALTHAAFDALETHPAEASYALVAAYFVKALALQGYRPTLEVCASCFEELPLTAWSHGAGGAVCEVCAEHLGAFEVNPELFSWIHFLMMATFNEIAQTAIDKSVLDDCTHILKSFFEYTYGTTLKSLPIFWQIAP